MISLRFGPDLGLVTCLGAHPDDIEIGAGATLARLAASHEDVRFRFIILTGTAERTAEANASAESLLGHRVDVVTGDFDENTLPYRDPAGVKEFLHEAGFAGETDVVLAPRRDDLHQDHRFVAELALQAFRDHPVLGYEIPKYDGDLGNTSLYVALTADEAAAKLDHLSAQFPSQHDKPWYSRELFASVMRIRGMEAKAASGFAEAFIPYKVALG